MLIKFIIPFYIIWPLITIFVLSMSTNPEKVIKNIFLLILGAFIPVTAWYIPKLLISRGKFLQDTLNMIPFPRFDLMISKVKFVFQSLETYLGTFYSLLFFLSLIYYFPKKILKQNKVSEEELIIATWLFFPLIFYIFYSSVLENPRYLIPILPALSIAVLIFLDEEKNKYIYI